MRTAITRMIDDFERGRVSRRQLILGLTALVGGGSLAARSAAAAVTGKSTFEATELNHIALAVTDVARSRDFYQKHLGLTPMSGCDESRCFLRCGRHFVALFKAGQGAMHHYCYTIEGYDPSAAVKTLKAAGLKPDRRSNRVYFDDPDGLEVQVAAPNG